MGDFGDEVVDGQHLRASITTDPTQNDDEQGQFADAERAEQCPDIVILQQLPTVGIDAFEDDRSG